MNPLLLAGLFSIGAGLVLLFKGQSQPPAKSDKLTTAPTVDTKEAVTVQGEGVSEDETVVVDDSRRPVDPVNLGEVAPDVDNDDDDDASANT